MCWLSVRLSVPLEREEEEITLNKEAASCSDRFDTFTRVDWSGTGFSGMLEDGGGMDERVGGVLERLNGDENQKICI